MLQDMLTSAINYTYPALLVLLLLVPAWLFVQERGWKERLTAYVRGHCWQVLFFFCMAFIVTATVISRSTTNPFQSVFKHFGPGDEKWNNEIIENVLLFIPPAFLLLKGFPEQMGEKPLVRVMLFSAALTLFIELSQLIFWLGEFQFSDLFHNMLGGLIGYGLWAASERIKQRSGKHGK